MLQIEDLGEVAYGGAVTLAEWWDNRRISEGRLTSREVLKKASFYTYAGIGLSALLASQFGLARNFEKWTERISIGFLYDLPRQVYSLSQAMTARGQSRTSESAAVRYAQDVINTKNRQLAAGTPLQRSYQSEFQKVRAL